MSAATTAPPQTVEALALLIAWRFPGMDLSTVDVDAVHAEMQRVFVLLNVLEAMALPDDLFTID